MTDIDLDAPPRPEWRPGRTRLVVALASPAPTALVLAVAVLAVLAVRAPDPRPAAPVVHEVRVGVSAFPAQAVARWTDRAGAVHELDPWSGQPVRVPARSVVVAVAGDADCTLVVDGTTVDTASGRGGVAVCSWVAIG